MKTLSYYIPSLNKTKTFLREGSTATVVLTNEELDEVFTNLKSVFPDELTPIAPKARSMSDGWKVIAYIKEWE